MNPHKPVTSYNFLHTVPHAQEVTAWDGALQQFGASAMWAGGHIVGTDFTFVLGYGYFVTMDSAGIVNFDGNPVTLMQVVSTHAGLEVVSLVGGPSNVTSYTVFDTLFLDKRSAG